MIRAWQNRSLELLYPIVFFDYLVVKARQDKKDNQYLRDEQRDRIKDSLPGKEGDVGRKGTDNRGFIRSCYVDSST